MRFRVEQDQKDSTQQIAGTTKAACRCLTAIITLKTIRAWRRSASSIATTWFRSSSSSATADKADAEAKSVIDIETALAKGSLPRVELRNPDNVYHIMKVTDLNTLAPDFDWTTYIDSCERRTSTRSMWPRRNTSRR